MTQDHLDFHGSLGAYRDAKFSFSARRLGAIAQNVPGVVNMDDPAGRWIRSTEIGFWDSACRAQRDGRGRAVRSGRHEFRVRTAHGSFSVALRLRGAFNVMNALAAF